MLLQVVHAYYQWLTPLFLILALVSGIPRQLWRVWEGGLLQTLLPASEDQLQEVQAQGEDAGRDYCHRISNYFRYNLNSARHSGYEEVARYR